jgi:hypothetical protein
MMRGGEAMNPQQIAVQDSHALSPEVQKRKDAYQALRNTMQLELSKVVWTSSVDFIRSTSSLLQTITTLLVTSYLGFIAALGRQLALYAIPTWVVILPICLFILSLGVSFGSAALYQGERMRLTNLRETATAFEETMKRRREQLLIPAILTMLGILALAYFAYELPTLPERPGP